MEQEDSVESALWGSSAVLREGSPAEDFRDEAGSSSDEEQHDENEDDSQSKGVRAPAGRRASVHKDSLRSCASCAKGKRQCDGLRPCSRCCTLARGHLCVDVQPSSSRSRPRKKGDRSRRARAAKSRSAISSASDMLSGPSSEASSSKASEGHSSPRTASDAEDQTLRMDGSESVAGDLPSLSDECDHCGSLLGVGPIPLPCGSGSAAGSPVHHAHTHRAGMTARATATAGQRAGVMVPVQLAEHEHEEEDDGMGGIVAPLPVAPSPRSCPAYPGAGAGGGAGPGTPGKRSREDAADRQPGEMGDTEDRPTRRARLGELDAPLSSVPSTSSSASSAASARLFPSAYHNAPAPTAPPAQLSPGPRLTHPTTMSAASTVHMDAMIPAPAQAVQTSGATSAEVYPVTVAAGVGRSSEADSAAAAVPQLSLPVTLQGFAAMWRASLTGGAWQNAGAVQGPALPVSVGASRDAHLAAVTATHTQVQVPIPEDTFLHLLAAQVEAALPSCGASSLPASSGSPSPCASLCSYSSLPHAPCLWLDEYADFAHKGATVPTMRVTYARDSTSTPCSLLVNPAAVAVLGQMPCAAPAAGAGVPWLHPTSVAPFVLSVLRLRAAMEPACLLPVHLCRAMPGRPASAASQARLAPSSSSSSSPAFVRGGGEAGESMEVLHGTLAMRMDRYASGAVRSLTVYMLGLRAASSASFGASSASMPSSHSLPSAASQGPVTQPLAGLKAQTQAVMEGLSACMYEHNGHRLEEVRMLLGKGSSGAGSGAEAVRSALATQQTWGQRGVQTESAMGGPFTNGRSAGASVQTAGDAAFSLPAHLPANVPATSRASGLSPVPMLSPHSAAPAPAPMTGQAAALVSAGASSTLAAQGMEASLGGYRLTDPAAIARSPYCLLAWALCPTDECTVSACAYQTSMAAMGYGPPGSSPTAQAGCSSLHIAFDAQGALLVRGDGKLRLMDSSPALLSWLLLHRAGMDAVLAAAVQHTHGHSQHWAGTGAAAGQASPRLVGGRRGAAASACALTALGTSLPSSVVLTREELQGIAQAMPPQMIAAMPTPQLLFRLQADVTTVPSSSSMDVDTAVPCLLLGNGVVSRTLLTLPVWVGAPLPACTSAGVQAEAEGARSSGKTVPVPSATSAAWVGAPSALLPAASAWNPAPVGSAEASRPRTVPGSSSTGSTGSGMQVSNLLSIPSLPNGPRFRKDSFLVSGANASGEVEQECGLVVTHSASVSLPCAVPRSGSPFGSGPDRAHAGTPVLGYPASTHTFTGAPYMDSMGLGIGIGMGMGLGMLEL